MNDDSLHPPQDCPAFEKPARIIPDTVRSISASLQTIAASAPPKFSVFIAGVLLNRKCINSCFHGIQKNGNTYKFSLIVLETFANSKFL